MSTVHPQYTRKRLHRRMAMLQIVMAPWHFLQFLVLRFFKLIGLESWFVQLIFRSFIKNGRARMENGFKNVEPTAQDVFVCSFPKSGTNWGLQIAYQIANRGKGEYEHIHDVVAWPDEPHKGIAVPYGHEMASASLTGLRAVKTHVDAGFLPYSPEAKYICIVRDPKDVVVSAYHFFRDAEVGFLMPSVDAWVDLLLSGISINWPNFTQSYWLWRNRPNVLFLTFEQMKTDLEGTVRKIADLMDVRLTPEELEKVCYLSSYAYMKTIDHKFYAGKVTPLASAKGSMIRSGKKESSDELLSIGQQQRIDDYCQQALIKLGSDFPFESIYLKK